MAKSTYLSKVKSLDNKEQEIFKVLDDQQAAQTTSDEVDVINADLVSIGVRSNSPAVSGGTVVLEGCPVPSDSPTWISLATVTVAAGSRWAGADAANGLHVCQVVRARITGQIANGNVDVYIG